VTIKGVPHASPVCLADFARHGILSRRKRRIFQSRRATK
jgi:hypothetical protein